MMSFIKSLIINISVEPVTLFFILITYLEYASVQDLIFTKLCFAKINTTDNAFCSKSGDHISKSQLKEIQTETSNYLLYYNAILSFFGIFSSFLAGSYGDKHGRLLPMSIPSMFSIVVQILLLICSIFENLTFIVFVCAFISGISAGSVGVIANSFGFIADITNFENRTKRITVLEASLFFGSFAGNLIAGSLIKSFVYSKFIIIFSVNLVIHILVLIYIKLRLTQIPNPTHDRILNQSILNQSISSSGSSSFIRETFDLIIDVFRTTFKKRPNFIRTYIIIILIGATLAMLGTVVKSSLLFLFVKNKPLNWDTSNYGYFLALTFAISGTALCILPIINYLFDVKLKETIMAMLGVSSRGLGLAAIGISSTTTMAFSCSVLFIFSEYTLPALRSLLSKLIHTDERGKIFSFLACLQNICFFIGGIAFNNIYQHSVKNDYFTGLSFEIVAAFQIIALVLFM